MDEFWLTDAQFAKIEPHLPTDTRGKERVDDRRVISGIIHVLKSGGRWADAPREVYGPKKTLYNRFRRWAAKGYLIPRCGDTVAHHAAREALWAKFSMEAPPRRRQSVARSSYVKRA